MSESQDASRLSWIRWGIIGAILLSGLVLFFLHQSSAAPVVPLEGADPLR